MIKYTIHLTNNKRSAGFTLIEIIIALAILAFIAVIISIGLRTVISSQKHIEIQAKQLAELQVAITTLDQDVRQFINRPLLDNAGEDLPALIISNLNNGYLEFTRTGLINPLAASNRSSLQRIAYLIQEGNLIRQTWPALDRAPTTKPSQRILLHQVKSMEIAWLDDKTRFIVTDTKTSQTEIPKGIAITLNLSGNRQVKRIYSLPEP